MVLPEELTKIFELYDYDDLNLCIANVDFSSNDFKVEFHMQSVGMEGLDELDEKWTLTATGHKDSRISFDYAASIVIEDEHPLLWKYLDTQCELYFNGQYEDIPKLFVDLYDIHFEVFGHYSFIDMYLNIKKRRLCTLMQGNNGLLARGPKKLLTKYAECLKDHGIDYSIIGERPPVYWNGTSFEPESAQLKVLFMGETDTYIVAEDFTFAKQDKINR